MRPPEMTVLSDSPIEEVGDDGLGMASRLAVVLDILRHRETRLPMTIAIYGDWGTGKTSAMHWLEKQVEKWNGLEAKEREYHPRVYPVWFDPWKYTTREEVWRGIIAEVILATFSVRKLDGQNFRERITSAARKFGVFLGKSFLHALANTKVKLGAGMGVGKNIGANAETEISGEMFADIYKELENAQHPEKAHLNQFEQTLRSWVEDFLKKDKTEKDSADEPPPSDRLVVFIDDLDRCLPEVTLEVLEAIKLYLAIPQLLFVVGVDRAVVDGVVARHYQDHGLNEEKARKYLDKIFQVEIHIAPSELQMDGFAKIQIENLDTATGGYWNRTLTNENHRAILEAAIKKIAQNNPREIKRLISSALVRGRTAADNESLKQENNDPKLLFVQGVQFFLLQRLTQRLSNGENLLLSDEGIKWFEHCGNEAIKLFKHWGVKAEGLLKGWGNEAAKNSQPHPSSLEQGEKAQSAPGQTGQIEFNKQINDLIEACRGKAPLDRNKQNIDVVPLLLDSTFWRLLLIPFDVTVAHCVPVSERADKAAPVSPAGQSAGLSSWPVLLRDRIARALKKPVEQLVDADLGEVKEIDLVWSPIADKDLSHLVKLTTLQWLDLWGTQVTDAGLQEVAKLTALQRLDLGGTQVTNAGVAELQRRLPKTKTSIQR